MDLYRSPTSSEIVELVCTRRSIRRYTRAPVSDDVVQRILRAGISAPSAHNRQPWRFAVVRTTTAKKRLADAMGARLSEDRGRDGDAPDDIKADVARSIARITGAPVVIVICMAMDEMDSYSDQRRASAEYLMAVQSTAMLMQNIQLVTHALGLGSSIMCAPLFCPGVVRSALDLPSGWQPQALITLGVPANAGRPSGRRPLHEVMLIVD